MAKSPVPTANMSKEMKEKCSIIFGALDFGLLVKDKLLSVLRIRGKIVPLTIKNSKNEIVSLTASQESRSGKTAYAKVSVPSDPGVISGATYRLVIINEEVEYYKEASIISKLKIPPVIDYENVILSFYLRMLFL